MFACLSELNPEDERHVVLEGNFSAHGADEDLLLYEGRAVGSQSAQMIELRAVVDIRTRNGSFELSIEGKPGVSGLMTVNHMFQLMIYQFTSPIELIISSDFEQG